MSVPASALDVESTQVCSTQYVQMLSVRVLCWTLSLCELDTHTGIFEAYVCIEYVYMRILIVCVYVCAFVCRASSPAKTSE